MLKFSSKVSQGIETIGVSNQSRSTGKASAPAAWATLISFLIPKLLLIYFVNSTSISKASLVKINHIKVNRLKSCQNFKRGFVAGNEPNDSQGEGKLVKLLLIFIN